MRKLVERVPPVAVQVTLNVPFLSNTTSMDTDTDTVTMLLQKKLDAHTRDKIITLTTTDADLNKK